MSTTTMDLPKLTRKDFVSDQEVRWCPGCGDYAILAQIQRVLPDIGVPKENIVFISGIGCSSRFPYYMNTYGIHSIHGRAPTLATGLKIANPDLSVWVITGDGDALSIGGNHLIHALRRNADLKILLFNNRIYGLTKGQYSPTSLQGHRSKSSPMGSLEQPLNPISVALGAEATFVARTVDVHSKHLQETLSAAAAHKGTAFVEIFQNCLIFNDNAWQHVTDRQVKDENILPLEHGQPMVFGKNMDKGLRLNGLTPEVVQLENGFSEKDLMVHDENAENPFLAFLLSRLNPPDFPTPLGIFRRIEKPSYSDGMVTQVKSAQAKKGKGDLKQLFHEAETWVVEADESITDTQTFSRDILGIDEEYMENVNKEETETSSVEHSLETDLVIEIAHSGAITTSIDSTLTEVIAQLRAKNIGSILVVDKDGKLSGVFTERDILTKVAGKVDDLSAVPVSAYMTPNPTSINHDDLIAHALHLMAHHGFRHLPIVDAGGKPVGMISFRDVVEFIERYFA